MRKSHPLRGWRLHVQFYIFGKLISSYTTTRKNRDFCQKVIFDVSIPRYRLYESMHTSYRFLYMLEELVNLDGVKDMGGCILTRDKNKKRNERHIRFSNSWFETWAIYTFTFLWWFIDSLNMMKLCTRLYFWLTRYTCMYVCVLTFGNIIPINSLALS